MEINGLGFGQFQVGQMPPAEGMGPPPPPGDDLFEGMSEEEIEAIKEKMDSLTEEQRMELREKMHEKMTESPQRVSKEEMKTTFLDLLDEILSEGSASDSEDNLDTYV